MKEEKLKSWEQFREISCQMIRDARERREEGDGSCMDYPLFRGVRDSTKPLESSLQSLGKAGELDEYWHTIKIVRKEVETVTGKKWSLEPNMLPKVPPTRECDVPAYEFMAYLRQNGFPSPLLDWTKSPYIAAFFAFRDIYCSPADKEYVSIFAYREWCEGEDGYASQDPRIHRIGPTIATFPTHYLQQSEYSVCVRTIRNREDEKIQFAKYEDVKGDELIKYSIPMSEQNKVLRELDSMNITAYSLFDSEPSLMDTLAVRELVLEKG